jgi:predicted DNA-binding protein
MQPNPQFSVVEHKGGIAFDWGLAALSIAGHGLGAYCVFKTRVAIAIRDRNTGRKGFMGAKKTYSVRLDDEQREQMEAKASKLGLPTGHLIRVAIHEYLRQEEEKDYLGEVQANIITAINRLIRHIEKDRAEQQIIAGMLDHVREFLAFTLPTPADHMAANALMEARNKVFYGRLPTYFVSGSKAKVTAHIENVTGGQADTTDTASIKGE